MSSESHPGLSWSGSKEAFLDKPAVTLCKNIVVGRYGGRTDAGQHKNEDGAFALSGQDWEFMATLDAHNSSESVECVLELLESKQEEINAILSQTDGLMKLHPLLLTLLTDNNVLREAQGETALLVCARKGPYLYWFSIGDCVLYLLQEELAQMGQYKLTERQFYEWVGQSSAFNGAVPCYSMGFRELRKGRNTMLLVTDGLLEYQNSPFADSSFVNTFFVNGELQDKIADALQMVHEGKGRDSATIVGVTYTNPKDGVTPTG